MSLYIQHNEGTNGLLIESLFFSKHNPVGCFCPTGYCILSSEPIQ